MKYMIFLKSGNYLCVTCFHRVGNEIWICKNEVGQTSLGVADSVAKAEHINILEKDIEKIITFHQTR